VRSRLRPNALPRTTALVLALVTALVAGIALVTPTALAQTGAAAPVVDAAAFASTTQAIRLQEAAIMQAEQQAAAAPHLAAQRAYAAHKAAVAKVQQTRVRLVQVAKKQIGDRYSAGSSGPNAFDCSGLTRYVYKTVTGKELPHQSHAQYARVKRISRASAKPGDLVFFFRGGAHHVGIYIGNGRMVDAAGYGEGVRISPISGSWWGRTYSGMGRLLPA
jgi:cell wall-associated NlpC family hydrolase